jgi:RHS repeat-associated protein
MRRGSTALTATSSGAKSAELRYKAWGETRYTYGTTPTTYRFTGQREDATIALYFYNARYYDPALGRFIQADTLVPDPADPQSLNRFAYVRNNPLNRIDPGGQADVGAGDVGSCDDSFCSAELQELYARWKAAKYQILSFRAYERATTFTKRILARCCRTTRHLWGRTRAPPLRRWSGSLQPVISRNIILKTVQRVMCSI